MKDWIGLEIVGLLDQTQPTGAAVAGLLCGLDGPILTAGA